LDLIEPNFIREIKPLSAYRGDMLEIIPCPH